MKNFFCSAKFLYILLVVVIFALVGQVFIEKHKIINVRGYLDTNSSVEVLAYAEEQEGVFVSFSAQKMEKSGNFSINIPTNNVYGIKLFFEGQDLKLKLSDVVVEGRKAITADLTKAQVVNGVKENQGNVLSLTAKENVEVLFNVGTKLAAKRVYNFNSLITLCLLPLIALFLPKSWQKNYMRMLLLLVPLLLFFLIRYFSFEHSFGLYYREKSIYNIFMLEKYGFGNLVAFYGFLGGLIYFSQRWIRAVLSILLFGLLLILTVDGVVMSNLNARFIFDEIQNYKSEYATAFWMFVSYLGTLQGRLALLLWLCCIAIVHYKPFNQRKYALMAWGLAVLLGILKVGIQHNFLLDYEFYDVFTVNQSQQQGRKYTEQFSNDLLQRFEPYVSCEKGLNKRKNLILVAVESLSSFNSKFLGGVNDYMPYFDELIKKGTIYTNYYSNSYNTNGGLFSIVSGLPLVHGYSGLGNLTRPVFYAESLPNKLKKAGYQTSFWTGIDLNGGLRGIIEMAGFDTISDCQDAFYQGKPRIVFNAPADEFLFQNVAQVVQNYKSKEPYFMMVSTISGHGPYIDPETKKQSLELVVKYVDRKLSDFVKQLEEIGFFENGMLVITGGHRAMVPVAQLEADNFPLLPEGKVPLLIIDKDHSGKVEGLYSHKDLASSLQYYLTDKGCFNAFQNNIFEQQNENCVLYQQLTPLYKINLLCQDKQAEIYLNGDETSWGKDNVAEAKYIDFVNWFRIKQEK